MNFSSQKKNINELSKVAWEKWRLKKKKKTQLEKNGGLKGKKTHWKGQVTPESWLKAALKKKDELLPDISMIYVNILKPIPLQITVRWLLSSSMAKTKWAFLSTRKRLRSRPVALSWRKIKRCLRCQKGYPLGLLNLQWIGDKKLENLFWASVNMAGKRNVGCSMIHEAGLISLSAHMWHRHPC